jgi:acyl carrier protein
LQEQEIYQTLTGVFHQVFNDDTITVTSTLTADDVPGWDSLSNIRLILTIEKTFQVKLSAAEIDNVENVGDLVALIRTKLLRDRS